MAIRKNVTQQSVKGTILVVGLPHAVVYQLYPLIDVGSNHFPQNLGQALSWVCFYREGERMIT